MTKYGWNKPKLTPKIADDAIGHDVSGTESVRGFNLKNWEKEFYEKLVGKPSAYHDPITHQNYPGEYTEKMLVIKDIKQFIRTLVNEALDEVLKDWGKNHSDWSTEDKIQDIKSLFK